MLIGISPVIGPELLNALFRMGHGDEIVLADAFFPGAKFNYEKLEKTEPRKTMTIPLIILAALCLILGIFPGEIIAFINGIAAILF